MGSRTPVRKFEGKQLLRHAKREIVVRSSGETLKEAANNAFQSMRKQIFQEFTDPIVRLEASEVVFEDVAVDERTERFFFIFWPRTKRTFYITSRININIDYLDITEEE